jgi:predicted transcriptional regulator
MGGPKPDFFVSGETEIEVDETTAAAIRRGIQAADDGPVVTGEEVREQIRQWISEFSTPDRR